MPDITMCNNDKCPLAKKCYRHEAKPNPNMQFYIRFKPEKNRKKCEHFIKMEARND